MVDLLVTHSFGRVGNKQRRVGSQGIIQPPGQELAGVVSIHCCARGCIAQRHKVIGVYNVGHLLFPLFKAHPTGIGHKGHPIFWVIVKVFVQNQCVILFRRQGVVPATGGSHAAAVLLSNIQQLRFGQVVTRINGQPPTECLAHAAAAEPELPCRTKHTQLQ